jgi:two-component system chemotaxis response regulator CheY
MSRILIIEDEKPLRDAFSLLLTSVGHEVDLAENGKAGLNQLAKHKPDLVILDMLMPVMDGRGFLEAAKGTAALDGSKVLILSNLSDPVSVKDIEEFQLGRPVLKSELSPVELVKVVDKELNKVKE